MFVNPGRIRPWEWLVLLNYLNEPALAMALVVKHRHTGTCTGTNHLPSPRSSRKASQENSCQSFGHLPALTDSLLRGRKRQRQSCVLPNASGITVSVSEGNSELRLLYIAFLYRLYAVPGHTSQTPNKPNHAAPGTRARVWPSDTTIWVVALSPFTVL